jgi:formylglycine-generating enzyme required for sulfatase activity
MFCEWLTAQYNENPKRRFKKVLFRLPTEEEWMYAARGGDASAIYPWEAKEIRNKKGQVMANFKIERGSHDSLDPNVIADITAPVTSYWKNGFGLYNMGGNVSEMVQEKGIIKGGSWRDGSEYLKIEAKLSYDGKPQPSVGFRYFGEILER